MTVTSNCVRAKYDYAPHAPKGYVTTLYADGSCAVEWENGYQTVENNNDLVTYYCECVWGFCSNMICHNCWKPIPPEHTPDDD